MEFYLLASGSKGNCFVLKTAATQIVIDCGTTKTYLTRSFHMIGVDYLNTEALLVTHGHRDHTSQLKMFSNVQAYAAFRLENRADQHWIVPYVPFQVGDLRVTPLPLSHDAENTVGYVLETAREKLVYITAAVSDQNADSFRQRPSVQRGLCPPADASGYAAHPFDLLSASQRGSEQSAAGLAGQCRCFETMRLPSGSGAESCGTVRNTHRRMPI